MRIGIVGIPMPITNSLDLSNEEIIDQVYTILGHNSGNMLYLNGALSFINTPENIINCIDISNDPDYYDLLYYPAANLIGTHVDASSYRSLIGILNKFNCPFIILGLGAQIEYVDVENKTKILSKELKLFLRTLSDKCHNIHVRCDNTKNILNSLNIENVIVTGCPSILLNTNSRLGDIIEDKIHHLRNNITDVKLNLNYQEINRYSKVAKKIFNCSKENSNAPLIIQDNKKFIKHVYMENITDTDFTHVDEIFSNDLSHFQFFYKITDWLEFLDNYNCGLGLRIHGAVVNIINENIGINICHDIRTKGLSETLKIPYINIDDFMKCGNDNLLQTILDVIIFDKDSFNDNRIRIAGLYKDELDHFHVPTSKHLDDIITKRINEKTFNLFI